MLCDEKISRVQGVPRDGCLMCLIVAQKKQSPVGCLHGHSGWLDTGFNHLVDVNLLFHI